MRFGLLTLIEELPDRWRGYVVALWRCDCGVEKKIPMYRVKSGNAKSCGCLKERHGACKSGTRTAEYVAWGAMNARCRAKKGRDFDGYAARGIHICDRWAVYENFLSDMGPRPSPAHSVGRIDNNLGYSPDNCRWETPLQQQRNTKKSKRWHIRGLGFESAREAGKHYAVDHKTILYWVKTHKDGCYVVDRY